MQRHNTQFPVSHQPDRRRDMKGDRQLSICFDQVAPDICRTLRAHSIRRIKLQLLASKHGVRLTCRLPKNSRWSSLQKKAWSRSCDGHYQFLGTKMGIRRWPETRPPSNLVLALPSPRDGPLRPAQLTAHNRPMDFMQDSRLGPLPTCP